MPKPIAPHRAHIENTPNARQSTAIVSRIIYGSPLREYREDTQLRSVFVA